MGLISRLYTFQTMPGISPDIGRKIDEELNQILNLVNGALDNLNVGGNPDIDSSKLNLGGAGFVPTGGGQLTGLLEHLFSGIWRKMGASGGVKIREYRDTGAGVAYGIVYNTEYSGGFWIGRDIADICMRFELTTDGLIRFYWAPSAASGVTPTWYAAQHLTPLGGNGSDGDVVISANQTVSGIFNYKNLTINAGVTWTLDTGKPLIIFARESVTINGTIDGNGKGRSGGAKAVDNNSNGSAGQNGAAGSGGGGGGKSGAGSSVGGKGGDSTYFNETIVGGTGAGDGATGGNGTALSLIKRLIHELGILAGAGGGGGASFVSNSGGDGGAGGGFIFVVAPTVTISSTGVIRCNGNAGQNAGGSGGGGGGGGGGGVIFIQSKKYANSGSLSVTGGSGGTGNGGGGSGGIGGVGVSYIEDLKG